MVRGKQPGFTIIEVLIVLAIAGLIIMIVFLSVPALRRNQQNTLRKNDARYLAAQRMVYNMEQQTSIATGGFDCSLPYTTKLFCTYIATGLTHYDLDNVTFHNSGNTAPTTIPTITDGDHILTDTYLKCDANSQGAVVASHPRSSVVLYAIETRNGFTPQCLESSVFPQ